MDKIKHEITSGPSGYAYGKVLCFDCNRKGGGALLAQEGGRNSLAIEALTSAQVSLLMEVARTHATTNGSQGHRVVLFEWKRALGDSNGNSTLEVKYFK